MNEKFKININRSRTLPSLCMNIFTKNFLKIDSICIVTGIPYFNIVQSYRGGFVDVYRPSPIANSKINSYDINSLYPSAMRKFPMPIGNPDYFEDYTNSNKYFYIFGFVFATIESPENLYTPILQTKALNNKNKFTGPTICPTGT
jgi:hypothetical protein